MHHDQDPPASDVTDSWLYGPYNFCCVVKGESCLKIKFPNVSSDITPKFNYPEM